MLLVSNGSGDLLVTPNFIKSASKVVNVLWKPFLSCTNALTVQFISDRTGETSIAAANNDRASAISPTMRQSTGKPEVYRCDSISLAFCHRQAHTAKAKPFIHLKKAIFTGTYLWDFLL